MKNQPSLPKEFEEAMRHKLGGSFDLFQASLQQHSPVSIRINPHKNSPVQGDAVAWCKTGRYLTDRPVFTLDPAFHAGTYYVQEASSMFLEQAITQTLDPLKPVRVLDLCAAPGGKSTHLLSMLPKGSLLVSNEVIRSRASTLSENIQKWGHANVIVTNNDPENFSRLEGFFDVIVVDAPCSGEGLFRKDTDAMQEWSPANVDLCSKRQRRILADIWPALRTGGILIYSTCTYNEQENEENVSWMQEKQNIESLQLQLNASWGVEEIQKQNTFGYKLYPHKVKGEGFFLSAFRKTEPQQTARLKIKKSRPAPSRKIIDQLKAWVTDDTLQFCLWQELVYAITAHHASEIELLVQELKIVHAGTPLATIKHDKLIPEHAAALSIHLNKDHFQRIDVSVEDALQYLRKEPIAVSASKGFALVMHQNLPMGWLNVLDNRSNNLYPKEWRIRMAG